MNIGIDARFLTHPQQGGFKTYSNNLISAMSKIDDINQYYLYVDRPLGEVNVPKMDNWHTRVIDGSLPVVGMPLREQLLIPKQISDDKLDIVHFLCNTAPVNLSTKYIITLHDTIQVEKNNTFKFLNKLSQQKKWAIMAYSKWAINHSVREAIKIITVSNYEKDRICGWFNISSDQVVPIHLATNSIFTPASDFKKNLWRSDFAKEYGISKKYILGIGFEPRKNIELLIDAYSRIASKLEDIDLVIVCAEKNRRFFFQKLVDEFGILQNVTLLGSVPPEKLVILYNLAEIFVFPSERESFGLPPLEAISCGVPTIAMNNSSIPEVLGDGAILIEGKDPQLWANAILQIIKDSNLSSQLIQRGLNRASKFSWQRCAQETISVYTSAMDV